MKKVTILLLSLAGFIAGTTSALAAPDVGVQDKVKHPAVILDKAHQDNNAESGTEQDANTPRQE
ncbi:MAG: hypothetical protein CK426_08800 [Legionella sp.]|nr:MAG: hypothetical protein CK423_07195 [Legionella sp.]PJD97160.1 MAG: hypothetical protein CK426_08800 [Legionella sp.]